MTNRKQQPHGVAMDKGENKLWNRHPATNGNLSAYAASNLPLRCANEAGKAGEDIPVGFRITNRGRNDHKFVERNYEWQAKQGPKP